MSLQDDIKSLLLRASELDLDARAREMKLLQEIAAGGRSTSGSRLSTPPPPFLALNRNKHE